MTRAPHVVAVNACHPLLTFALLFALAPRDAHACGNWALDDLERGITAVASAHTVTVSGTRRPQPVLFILDDHTPGSVRSTDAVRGGRIHNNAPEQPVVFDFDGDVLRLRGEPRGRVEGDQVTIGAEVFKVELVLAPRATWRHDMPTWDATVHHGGAVVARGRPSHVCGETDAALAGDVLRDIMLRRIALYLAWRELLANAAPQPRHPRPPAAPVGPLGT